MPKVSVILPTRNRLPLLKKCLRSISAQTYKDYEIVVADDASDDGTADFLRRMASKRLRFARLDVCVGSAAARNVAIAQAAGSLIAFIDDDDRWHPRKLEHQVAFMEAAKAPLCYTDFNAVTPDGKILCKSCLTCPQDNLAKLGSAVLTWILEVFRYRFVGKTFFPLISSVIMKRKLLERLGGFDSQFKIAFFDADLWQKVYSFGGLEAMKFFPQSLTRYCIHPGQATAVTVQLYKRDVYYYQRCNLSPVEFDIMVDYSILAKNVRRHRYCGRGRHYFCQVYPKLGVQQMIYWDAI